MKKRIAQAITVMLSCVLFVLYAFVPVSAQSPQPADIIELMPNTASNENLFRNISNLLPGATLSDTFVLRNKSSETCTFYLRPEAARVSDFNTAALKAESDDLLSQLTLKVEYFGVNEAVRPGSGQVLYNGTADHLTSGYTLTIPAYTPTTLGRLAPGQTVRLHVTVSVPSSMGNAYDGKQGKFWWHFSAIGDIPASSSAISSSSSSRPPRPPSSSTPVSSVPVTSSRVVVVSSVPAVSSIIGGPVSPGSRSASASPASSSVSIVSLVDSSPPLTEFPTGDTWALLNLILAVLGVVGSVVLLVGMILKRRNEAEEEEVIYDEETGEPIEAVAAGGQDDEDPQQRERSKYGLAWRILAAVTGVVSIVVFFLTEDMTKPLGFVDKWTPLMLVLGVLELVFVFLMRYQTREQNPEEDLEEE